MRPACGLRSACTQLPCSSGVVVLRSHGLDPALNRPIKASPRAPLSQPEAGLAGRPACRLAPSAPPPSLSPDL